MRSYRDRDSRRNRWLLLVALLALGCHSDGLPGGAGSPSSDGAAGDVGEASLDLGGIGASCQTACDCQPGLACVMDRCLEAQAKIYCCGSASCPKGELCQRKDTSFATCSP